MSYLTDKEKEIFSLVSSGLTTKQIAERLSISAHTVESHRKNLLRKYQAKNTAQLIQKILLMQNAKAMTAMQNPTAISV